MHPVQPTGPASSRFWRPCDRKPIPRETATFCDETRPVRTRLLGSLRLPTAAPVGDARDAVLRRGGGPGGGDQPLLLAAAGRGESAAGTDSGCTLVNTFPHDPKAFCQGLVFRDGFLYEGTGSYGESSIRKVELETGKVLQQHDLDADMFGEGIAFWQDQLIQLTWKNRTAIYYDPATFRERQRFSYQGEGWGLTYDGRQLIMSDGTATLRFIDPTTFAVKRQIVVRDGNRRIKSPERTGIRRG